MACLPNVQNSSPYHLLHIWAAHTRILGTIKKSPPSIEAVYETRVIGQLPCPSYVLSPRDVCCKL